ncbi:hypothetical protein CesoFtcFv8_026336 [Champsocephalus esox]|uniref:Uncharacterized protein n=1 Tax=Champsocephalus esox TaxID=159716 RepID=A0AAN8B2T1_9TELE|nr:hypothetical protein CesoFtcFv8_026336 [Champsocephalus esox]
MQRTPRPRPPSGRKRHKHARTEVHVMIPLRSLLVSSQLQGLKGSSSLPLGFTESWIHVLRLLFHTLKLPVPSG